MLPLPEAIEADLPALLERALAEDVGPGDVTTCATIPEGRRARARLLVKEEGVVAGLAVAERVFARVDPAIACSWHLADGERAAGGTLAAELEGPARSLLVAERLALNVLQRMSGIATATRRMADAARPATILDTRKTAPGLRLLDKWAVALGGGANHRAGLYDMVLVKDNHIAAAGGLAPALAAVRRHLTETGAALPVEVEVRTADEIEALLAAPDVDVVDRVLLDNLVRVRPDGRVDASALAAAVTRLGGRFATEASGNVTLETVPAIAQTGVDFISSGALTHSVRALDLSLKIAL
ncbi:MAG: carboxylating nicotinate-nucleotide diphosphorylase [Rubricoccaceae bacterium]